MERKLKAWMPCKVDQTIFSEPENDLAVFSTAGVATKEEAEMRMSMVDCLVQEIMEESKKSLLYGFDRRSLEEKRAIARYYLKRDND